MNSKIEISLKTIVTVLLVGVSVFVLSKITDILTQIFVAFVLMTALNPLVNRLQKLKIPRVLAIVISYVVLIALIAVVIAAILPPFVDQTTKLFAELNLPASPFLDKVSHLRFSATELVALFNQYGGSVAQVVTVILSTFSVVITFVTILVMTIYMLLTRDSLNSYILLLFRSSNRKERSKEFLNRLEQSLGSWVRGQLLLMLTIGFMAFIGLAILGIPYALPLALLAAFMEVLPNIGPAIAGIPAVLVAAISVSPLMGFVTLILFAVIQQVENNVVVPQILKHATGIRPLTTIALILVGFKLGGIMGAFLIIPCYIVVREVLAEFNTEIRDIIRS